MARRIVNLDEVIKKPLITEKASVTTEKFNRYGFEVSIDASKDLIKRAVEKFYDVKVLNIKTSIVPGKLKRVGRSITKSPKRKKAYAQLAEGQKIEFFKGV